MAFLCRWKKAAEGRCQTLVHNVVCPFTMRIVLLAAHFLGMLVSDALMSELLEAAHALRGTQSSILCDAIRARHLL